MLAPMVIVLFATAAIAAAGVTLSSLLEAWRKAPSLRDAALADDGMQHYRVYRVRDEFRPSLATGRPVGADIIAFPVRNQPTEEQRAAA